ncbi:MAG: hypothetical protein ACI9EF_001916 [Pseudohongiellaceae bacterium]|jgi:hypothetical protein
MARRGAKTARGLCGLSRVAANRSWLAGLMLLCISMSPALPLQIDFASCSWMRNAEQVETPIVEVGHSAPHVELSFPESGTRWSTTFSTAVPTTWRLALDWELGAQGLLIEIMVDGEPLPPLRDTWRPTRRDQRADLGPRWLGQGEHLLEFVSREATDDGCLPVQRLSLQRL